MGCLVWGTATSYNWGFANDERVTDGGIGTRAGRNGNNQTSLGMLGRYSTWGIVQCQYGVSAPALGMAEWLELAAHIIIVTRGSWAVTTKVEKWWQPTVVCVARGQATAAGSAGHSVSSRAPFHPLDSAPVNNSAWCSNLAWCNCSVHVHDLLLRVLVLVLVLLLGTLDVVGLHSCRLGRTLSLLLLGRLGIVNLLLDVGNAVVDCGSLSAKERLAFTADTY